MIDLADLAAPAHTAVVTVELQGGVVGEQATIPELAAAARATALVANVARLCDAARAARVRVVHCLAEWRGDRAGTALQTPLAAALAADPAQILVGTPAAALVPELDGHPQDLRSVRRHGFTPFTGTDLDMVLRNCGVTTVVATGVSLNVGVVGLCLSAVDLGYRLVVPTDAVLGVPARYGEEVLHHTLRPLGTLTSVDALIAAWS